MSWFIDIHHPFIIHPSSLLSRCHFKKGRTAQQHMLGNGIQPDLPRIHMAYADGWLAPCGLKGNDDDDEKDDKDSASISSALVDILWRVLLFLFTTKYLSAIYHNSYNSYPFFQRLRSKNMQMLCIICSSVCTVESVAERRLWEIQQDEALLDVESTPSGNAKRRVHSVNTEMVPVWFFNFFTCVWIWHCLRQQHHCCRIVGKPASQCIWIYSIWDDQNCCFWSQIQFGQADKTQTE